MLVLAHAGIPVEVVPGVTTAVAAPEAAGIPVTHRNMASGFLVLAGQTGGGLNDALAAVRPSSVTIVVMMGLAGRDEIASELMRHGWPADTRAAIVCGASTREEWIWTGTLGELGPAAPPDGVAGVLVVGEVVSIGEALAAASSRPAAADEVSYGRS
jgi:siroheme synthase